jgi:archaellum biogenesis protein FlaJ (TadC family)
MTEDKDLSILDTNDIEIETITIMICKDKKYDAFTEIINSIDTLANDSGYFKLIHYVNPTEYKIVER